MPPPAAPEDPIEREFASLRRKLDAARGFCFVVYFVEDPRPVQRIRSRLEAELGNHGRRLVVLSGDAAATLVTGTLSGIFDSAAGGDRPVVWAEAFDGRGDPAWDAQRRLLLMRMNERRSRFETQSAAALILLLPADAQREAASLAPDLWHVRLHSATLAATPGEASSPRTLDTVAPAAATDASTVPPAATYWHALREAAGDGSDALDALSLEDGFEAVRAWQGRSEPGRAVALAEALVRIARDRVDRQGPTADAPRRRELAVALRELGDSLAQAGRSEAALAALDEGVSLTTADPRVDADPALAASLLFSRGDALLAAGRPREALATFERSLALVRRLPDDPGAGGPWGVLRLLDRIGDAALRADDPPRAVAAFAESAALYRGLIASRPGDATLLRTLASALAQLGDAEWRQGRGERALGAYRQGLEALDAASDQGSDPGATERERALLLMRVGGIEQEGGREESALRTYETVLSLVRRPTLPEALLGPLVDELARRLDALANPAGRGAPGLPAASRLLGIARGLRAARESASTDENLP